MCREREIERKRGITHTQLENHLVWMMFHLFLVVLLGLRPLWWKLLNPFFNETQKKIGHVYLVQPSKKFKSFLIMIDAYEDEDSIDARLQSRFDRAMASTPRKDDSIDSDRTRPRFLSESPSESVTNRLFYDADRQRRTRMKMKMAMEQNESPRRPKISSYAKTIRRDSGDIGNRLYEQGRKQRERKIEARKRASLQNTTSTTRKRYATTGTTRSKHNNTKLGEDLYRRARASQLEKERKIAEAESVAKYNARPKLNKRSMRIASQSVRSGRDAFDRLSAPPRRTLDIDAESDLTFKPHIDEKSKSLSRRRDGGLSGTKRLERLFADESRVRKKVEKMRNRLREKELAECTFEPKFLNKSRKKIKSRTMLHRQAEWTKKRDDKIRRMREKRSIVHDEECTFTPKVAKKRSGVGRCSPSREVQGTTESIVFRLYDLLQVRVVCVCVCGAYFSRTTTYLFPTSFAGTSS